MLRKTNFLSISVHLSEIATFLTKKRSSLWIFPKMLQNNRKAKINCMWLSLRRKTVLLECVPFYWFDQKDLFKQILILLRIYPFQTCYEKHTFWVFQSSFWEPFFWQKREVLCEFRRKCFKTTEKHRLAVCGSIRGEIQFLLEFVPFYWFGQKEFFKQILILLRIYPFQTC